MKKLLTFLAAVAVLATARAQTVNIAAGTITGQFPGDVFDLPITVNTDLTGLNVFSFQLSVSRPSFCTFQSIIVEPGDLLQAWGTPAASAGTNVLVSGAGAVPLSGSGVLFRIRFQAVTNGTATVSFTPTASNFLNEGTPGLAFISGSVQVQPFPTISVSPSSAVQVIGESLSLSASGGQAPYTFSTLHPAVGTVSGNQWNAVGQGLGKAQANDANSFSGATSGWYDVRTFQMGIGNATGPVTQELRVPITMQNPSGASFFSGELQVNASTQIQLSGVDVQGYLLEGATLFTNTAGGNVQLAFSGTTAITPAAATDTLCWLKFTKVNTASGGFYSLSYGSALFDELLNARFGTGNVNFQALPNITISPNTATRQAGQTQQFTASAAAVPPLTWGVTNPAVGSVNASGLFTALNGGTTQVTVTDAIGNTATSGTISVHDAVLQMVSGQGPVGGQVWVPVVLGPSVNNEQVFSYQLTFGFNASQLSFQAWEINGTLSNGWTPLVVPGTGQVTVVAAGATPFQPGGLIGFLRFQLQPGFNNGQTSSVTSVSRLFNEGDPVVIHQNGTVTASNGACPTSGCTNPYACNYDPAATCEDGSCAFNLPCAVGVQVRAMLEGPYASVPGTMNDALRSAGLIPTADPYPALGYVHVGAGGGTVAPAVFSVAGNNAIVDWVVLELRSAGDAAAIVATRSALVQRDGDVVALDGVSPVSFTMPPGNYFVALRHRNHLGVMTAAPVTLGAVPAVVDFTSGSTTTYGSDAQRAITGTFPTRALWAGDVDRNNVVRYTGPANDRDPLLQVIGGSVPTNTTTGYLPQDVNMDGVVRYVGAANDRDPILQTVGGSIPTNTRSGTLP